MNKIVIGLNLKYYKSVLVSAILSVLCLFIPYISKDGVSVSAVKTVVTLLSGHTGGVLSILMLFGIIAMACGLILALINFSKPSKLGMWIWVATSTIECFVFTVLLFGTRTMLIESEIAEGGFMVKDFTFGYWLILIFAYITLWNLLKIVKSNPGYIILTILSVIWLFPITWIILTSFRAEQGYYVGYFIPKGFTLDNYINLFKSSSVIPFARWWINTFVVATCLCIFNTVIILGTSYVLSRTRFAGRTTLMKAMMIIGMFPGFMSMIAVYNILKGIGLAQTLVALIVVGVAGAAMGYYICKGFFDTIPKSLDEAAIIDGANRWQIFIKVTIPLAKPIIIYTALTSFLGPWSDYIFPSMLLGDKQASYTVAIGLKWLTDFQRIDAYYTQFAAGSIMVALPIVILFIALQRFYVEGLSGSVKG